jgi:uncharacterized iron-regulated membrane protein
MMVSSGRRARTRLRNRRAVATVIGLVAVAALCIFGLVSGFGGVGASRSAHPKKKKVVHARLAARPTSTAPAAVPTTTAPAPATPSTSTPPTTARTTSTTVRRPPPTTVAPPVPVPSTLPAATAFASATNLPEFCTVTVHVSTGAAQQYPLAAYVQNLGDLYTFTAYVGGYKVQVTANVVEVNHAAACQPTLANLRPV